MASPDARSCRALPLHANSASVSSPSTAASATFASNAAECVRWVLFVIFQVPLPAFSLAQASVVPLIRLSEFAQHLFQHDREPPFFALTRLHGRAPARLHRALSDPKGDLPQRGQHERPPIGKITDR
ncbi:hypothetical protein ACUTF1_16200 [Burkholderia pseudomallei]|uniref:hypothetical protein n=1 Tax=Burkholderia pseudomallei TaxID=28450 RepID=UPI001C8083F8|nr:hypothetical protein [Burkholderia pseudomallei]